MPSTAKYKFGFVKGLNSDLGPFAPAVTNYKDGKNCIHNFNGLVKNRQGIELLNENSIRTISDVSDSDNMFCVSSFYCEFSKNNGYKLECIFIRWYKTLLCFVNDKDPNGSYSTDFESIDIASPDFTFTLSSDIDSDSIFRRTKFSQEGNIVIMVNGKSPIYRIIWGGNPETMRVYKTELTEFNEDLYDVPRAETRDNSIPGWFCKDIPEKTGTSAYKVLDWIVSAAPSYEIEVFEIDSNGNNTKLTETTDYTYSESVDSTTQVLTATLTLTGSATTGNILRVYFGKDKLSNFKSSLDTEQIVVSDQNKDFSLDNSFCPENVSNFAGRIWFGGVSGPLDSAKSTTYSSYGFKPKKLWASKLYPRNLDTNDEIKIQCRTDKSPLDITDNLIVITDGSVYSIDNATRIFGIVSYESVMFVVASNGVWSITGPEDYFNVQEVIIKKLIDHPILSKEAIVATEEGVFIAGESEIFWINPRNQQSPVTKMVQNIIFDKYNKIPTDAKRQMFLRYDSYNKRLYVWYPNTTTQNKYNEGGFGEKAFVFDVITESWFGVIDITQGDWVVLDMITIPANSYFNSNDERFTNHKKINMVVLGKKNSNWTQFTLGILEGKDYCADYFGTSYESAFESYVETFNEIPVELTIGHDKIISRAFFFMRRTEKEDATDGFYEFPGAVYISKRISFADNAYAGPDYGYSWNSNSNSWVDNARQIYFPNKKGSTVVGGGIPPYEVIQASLKIRGRGNVFGFRVGNKFGDSTLTGTVQEQSKPWGLYGFQLDLMSYNEVVT